MRFVSFQGEKKLSVLVATHYGTLSAADAKRAEKLVIDANPSLKDLKAVAKGAVLRLPPLDTGRLTAPKDSPDDPTALPLSGIADRISEFAAELRAAIELETASFKADKDTFGSATVRQAVDRNPELKDAIDAAEHGMAEREARIAAASEFMKLLPEIRADLEKQRPR